MENTNHEGALKMSFDPNTIEHLGVRMYSTLPPVLAELIANSYDADAKNIILTLNDSGREKEIVLEDDGVGMTFDEINKKFLRIGRNRRAEDGTGLTLGGRKPIGKKGLGKLSFFGIAHEIEIMTIKAGKLNAFKMDWESIKRETGEYAPVMITNDEPCDLNSGTKITLRKLQRESDFSPESIATSLSKIFIVDPDFKILVRHNQDGDVVVTNERKYTDLDKEVEWDIPADAGVTSDYENKILVTGHLIATEKPISPKTNMRGITLFSRKKLVNQAEYFSDSTSSHFFSYLTGWLEVDFIDDFSEDVISTDRQSLNWDHPEVKKLREYLQELIRWLEKDWRDKRKTKRQASISVATGVNIPEWFEKLPEEIRNQIEPLVQMIAKDSELPIDSMSAAVKRIHGLIPEYAYYQWRYLHPEVQRASRQYYEDKNYYTAFLEASKAYINKVRKDSGSSVQDDSNMMENVFKLSDPVISVTEGFKRANGDGFDDDTLTGIRNAHREFSHGVLVGGRNPVSHEEIADLRDSNLFTERDCLDALSLLSHLFFRLDRSKKIK